MIDDDTPVQTDTRQQFGIGALFWITFVIGLGIAFLERLDSPDILWGGALSILIGLAVGSVIGRLTRKFHDALFWAVLVAAFGYMSVAGDPLYVPLHRLAWATVGACSGAMSGSFLPEKFVINLIGSAIAAGVVMLLYWLIAQRRTFDLQLDLIAAPLIGAMVAILIRMIMWVESKRYLPRYVTAAWLMAIVIVGNIFSR